MRVSRVALPFSVVLKEEKVSVCEASASDFHEGMVYGGYSIGTGIRRDGEISGM